MLPCPLFGSPALLEGAGVFGSCSFGAKPIFFPVDSFNLYSRPVKREARVPPFSGGAPGAWGGEAGRVTGHGVGKQALLPGGAFPWSCLSVITPAFSRSFSPVSRAALSLLTWKGPPAIRGAVSVVLRTKCANTQSRASTRPSSLDRALWGLRTRRTESRSQRTRSHN